MKWTWKLERGKKYIKKNLSNLFQNPFTCALYSAAIQEKLYRELDTHFLLKFVVQCYSLIFRDFLFYKLFIGLLIIITTGIINTAVNDGLGTSVLFNQLERICLHKRMSYFLVYDKTKFFNILENKFNFHLISCSDHWTIKCIHTTTHIRRIPRCVSGYGTHGCESMSGHSNGFGPWTNVLSSISDVVWYKALAFSRHHS